MTHTHKLFDSRLLSRLAADSTDLTSEAHKATGVFSYTCEAPRECSQRGPEAMDRLNSCSRVWKTGPIWQSARSVGSGLLPVFPRLSDKLRNGAARARKRTQGDAYGIQETDSDNTAKCDQSSAQ